MIKNKLLVFDTTKGFARFIKIYFSDRFIINSCVLRKNLGQHDLKDYNLAFVMISSYEEIIDFLHIKLKTNHVFAVSNIPEIRLLLKEMPDVVFLDLEKFKKETIEDIINNLKIIEIL